MYTLYFGNKNYSSWSLRPWLLLKHFEIPFEEHQVQVSGKGAHAAHRAYSANGLVPCLHVDGFQVWDTLAIAEFLAERHPGLWPDDALARARARSVSCEMHSGFGAVRSAMPMNIKLRLKGKTPSAEVQADIDRIVAIWTEARTQFAGDGGPWLFGRFSVADAMFAPVVQRFATYNVELPPVAAAYRDAMLAHPAMVAWADAALAETVALPAYDAVADSYGGPR
ncbi:glutathione S-transferase family protein [Denitromonas iodatirespirans]|uniref:Glutathione S-transferase family protein n=1 Tax=Denitromonas iodatirespirans TaxID=2795389 RepID=A0A944D7E8_DENI1|nr:glutathione S-transferase family protein [Denitromonas iodatirespirans]MBT0961205.1 glutathione S-transferase family protein [Denitromonas iodatirespirans]